MRLDLFLKWSRVIPRRTLARATCDAGRVTINGEVARAAREVKVDDIIRVTLSARLMCLRVRSIPRQSPSKALASEMIEILGHRRREDTDT